MSSRTRCLVALLTFSITGSHAQSQAEHVLPVVVPLHKMPPVQWVEKVWGDPQKAGQPFAIRIHNDAGYIVVPHVHPMDENIVVVKGVWWFGMGNRFKSSALEPLELGTFGFGPKDMPHFAWSKTETIIHVYGIGPFSTKLIDPVYELTSEG